jgi:HAD superfamily hydrolase (TIGR01450 family)
MGLGQGAGRNHLTLMTLDHAFDAYEAARPRLPRAIAPHGTPEALESLAPLADRFDAFLLDAFGVLNIGETAIPGAVGRVADLQAAGKRVLIVSNAASVPHAALMEKYAKLGFRFAPEDVITSRRTLAHHMAGGAAACWGVMTPEGIALDDLGPGEITVLGDDPAPYAAVDGFLLVGSAGWSAARQALLEGALRARPRPVLVANPDIVAPRETGLTAEPGHFAHQLADRTGVSPQFFGKPFANIYDLAFARLGDVDRSRVVMVGDSLHTDILGAQTARVRSALITGYGFLAGRDAGAMIARSGIIPDFVVASP